MARDIMTDEQVEIEIERILHSEEFKLARKEERIKNRRRQYLYSLRCMERRGRQLLCEGFTLDNIEERLFGVAVDEEEE